jgi:glycosyltransferase involved in cell wall biosynthesis
MTWSWKRSRREHKELGIDSDRCTLRVHMVEVGGRGGVFQHAAAVAGALASAGADVTLHTAIDAEATVPGVRQCGCLSWYRSLPLPLRRFAVAIHFAFRTLPHLLQTEGEVIHVQGTFALPLTVAMLALCGHQYGTVAFSPHNTFRRTRYPLGNKVLRAGCRLSDVVFCFSESDALRLRKWGITPCLTRLAILVPSLPPGVVDKWRSDLRGPPLILMIGYVRNDKRPDLFIEAMELVPDCHGAIVGEDHGGLKVVREAAGRVGVEIVERYLSVEDFSAVVAAADVIVCPYDRASQSGVLTVARELGVATVATAVGGLAELATISVPPGDPHALAAGIREALHLGPQPPVVSGDEAARDALSGYGCLSAARDSS